MRRTLLALVLLLLLPGGFLVLAGLALVYLAQGDARKIDPRWAPSWRVLFWGGIWGLLYGVPTRFRMAVLSNEGASTPRPPTDEEATYWDGSPPALVYPVGDEGRSWGAGQVLDSNLPGLWSSAPWWLRWLVVVSDPRQLAEVGQEAAALWASVQLMAQALQLAAGDEAEAGAIYNGGPNHQSQAAEDYGGEVVEKEALEA